MLSLPIVLPRLPLVAGLSANHPAALRAAIAILFAVPAAVAGYHAALGLAQIGIPAEGWRHAIAVIGAIVVAATAWTRIVPIVPPDTGRASLPASPVRLSSAAHDGWNPPAVV
jgi:hypothetical protein